MLVADVQKLTSQVLERFPGGGITSRDVVALAAYWCGGFDRPLYIEKLDHPSAELLKTENGYCRALFDINAYKSYSKGFGMCFSQDKVAVLCSKIGFLPYPITLIQHFIVNCQDDIPMEEWWSRAEKIITDPSQQIQLILPRLQSSLIEAKNDRALAFSKFFEPATSCVTITGFKVMEFYKTFKPVERASESPFDTGKTQVRPSSQVKK